VEVGDESGMNFSDHGVNDVRQTLEGLCSFLGTKRMLVVGTRILQETCMKAVGLVQLVMNLAIQVDKQTGIALEQEMFTKEAILQRVYEKC